MYATVLLQMVCNTIVCRHIDYPNNIADLSIGDGSDKGLRVFNVDEKSRGGILQISWSDIW